MARVSPAPVAGPAGPEVLAGLPAYGRIMGSLAGSFVQQIASRGLSKTTFICSPTDSSSGPASLSIRMLHWVSPLARYLWVGFHYDADEAYTFAPVVNVSVYTTAGVLIDGPAAWTWANGTLTVHPPTPGLATSSRMLSRDSWACSERVVDPGVARPRLLDVDTYQGQDVEIRIATTSTRIWDVTVADDWQDEV